ncbi:hypothetical protein [Leisingera sp. JC11]|uniref:hypothetical protein n=1 Tax=Leisingera sp. JC11 TaxID=3042469 RepID=UPI0034543C8F
MIYGFDIHFFCLFLCRHNSKGNLMWKWIGRALIAAVVALIGYVAYDYYRADLHTRPEMPPGAFSISYKNGMRAILVDVPNERETRRYFGYPAEVPFYIEDVWAFCTPPEADEQNDAVKFIKASNKPGERFEVVCRIKVDDDTVIRGFITSVPRL